MPQQVLPFFGTEMHDRFAVTRALRPVREVPYVGKEISPLRGQQMNQIETFPRPSSTAVEGERKWTCVSALAQLSARRLAKREICSDRSR